ncbi:hypothetical protein EVAR_88123_1 [Eumeta japonica]|uniref:Uncharacterized protein n=1 Tax=Eumeta variegata TaxID=151549 RepID=A0A4C1WSE2_EUMVA|nr:hypothetical protein EVAR_88123_1 [Eumeta japonica]
MFLAFCPFKRIKIFQSDFTVQALPCLSMCKEQPEQLEKTKPEYGGSKSPHSDSDGLQKTEFDGPSNYPGVEKMTDQQQSFFSNQAVLLAENHRENIEFRSTECNGGHLTSSMWSHETPSDLITQYPRPSQEIAEALKEVKQTSRAPEAKCEAGHLLPAIKDFKFILNLTIWANILREINRVNIEIQKEDIILSHSVALMDSLLKTLQKMRQNPMEYWIKEAGEFAEKSGVDPILQNKRISKRKKHFDEMCEDELQTLQPVQLFSKKIMMVFDLIISEIKKRFDCATMLNLNFAFLNGTNILKMSIEELQKYGADLARKYKRDLSAVEFCQELYVFKEQAPLLFGDIEKEYAEDYTTKRNDILETVTDFYREFYNDEQITSTISNKKDFEEIVPYILRDEVMKAIKSLKKGKAPGEDNISNELLIRTSPIILNTLTNLFNEILTTEDIPHQWTTSTITLFYKKEKIDDISTTVDIANVYYI